MSGIEVAGLVLGAFPLLINALDGWRKSSRVAKYWWRHERAYKNFKYEVEFQERQYELNMDLYLLPLIIDDDNLFKKLKADPGGPAWREINLEERLKQRIPGDYDMYIHTIEAIKTAMMELRRQLEAGRFKFSLSEAHRNEILEKINTYNGRLRDLLDTNEKVTILKRNQTLSKVSKGLLHFWRHTNTIYSLLQRAWGCPCHHAHRANLLLKYRSTAEVEFSVLFLFGEKIKSPAPWTRQNTAITRLEGDLFVAVAKVPIQSQPARSTNDHDHDCAIKSHWTLKTKFEKLKMAIRGPVTPGPLPVTPSEQQAKLILLNKTPSMCNIQGNDATEITKLCEKIASCEPTTNCLGTLKDDENHYSISPLFKAWEPAGNKNVITLDNLLSHSSPTSLSRRQRYYIALTLASSHLQLHSTPWLGSQWRKKDICFLSDPTNAPGFLINEPYISRNFVPEPLNPHPPPHGDFSFLSLGIMLLELCFNMAFENYEPRTKMRSTDPLQEPVLDHAAATMWCGSVSDETGPEYAGAVMWCLNHTFMKNENWRKELVIEVIEPVRGCWEQLAISQ